MHFSLRPFAFVRGALVATALAAAGTALVWAQDSWPAKPVTYVVPFSPGGATDIIGRIYSQALAEALGQSVVVENRPGTGGSLGSAFVARAKSDGYTLVGGTISSHSINVSIYPSIGYDPIKSFEPIILTGTLPNVLVVRSDSAIQNVDDLIAAVKKSPENVSFGSSGVGSSQHLAGELFASMLEAKMLHVPYQGSSPSLQALLAGEIDVLIDNLPSAQPYIKAGKMRALAVTSLAADPALPNVQPLDQLGLPGYNVVSWQATFAPSGTPAPIIDKLYQSMHAALSTPQVQERMKTLGLTISGAGPEALRAFQQEEVQKWGKVARDANIRLE